MNIRKQHGLSLIELMIAVSLSLVLILGVGNLFSSSKQTFRVQDNLSRMHESARFALDTLSHHLRMAGSLGCDTQAPLHSNITALADFTHGIRGYESHNLPTIIYGNKNLRQQDIAPQSDVIVVSGSQTLAIPVTHSDPNNIHVDSNHLHADTFSHGDLLIISDCTHSDVFEVNLIEHTQGLIGHAGLSKTYGHKATLRDSLYSAFYIEQRDGSSYLMRRYFGTYGGRYNTRNETLSAGIQDMQILYGEDLRGDGSLIRYVDADQAQMQRVTAIRIHLLLASSDHNLSPTAQSFWFDGQLHTASDRRLYRSYATTIQLRNKAGVS